MNNLFTIDTRAVKRILYTMLAALLVVAGLPFFSGGRVSADQLSTRSIQLSDSAASGTSITTGVGSGTNVTYQVSFTPGAAVVNTESLVIDFCSQDPIINDTCTAPTGMTAATGVSNVTGTAGGTGWTLTASAGQAKLANDGVTAHDIVANTPQVFRLTGITNPSTVGSFYARIYTFANNSWGTYASATSAGNFIDYGGDALSTTRAITITARVQETLTFCVTSADPTTWASHDCSAAQVSAAPPALTLGHTSGGTTKILDSSVVDTGTVYSSLSTNSTHGAIISLRNSNTSCGGLSADGGTTCAIPAINGGVNTGASAMAAGTAAFGLFVGTGAPDGAVGTATGSTTASTVYHNSSHVTVPTDVWYGMDTATALGPTSAGPVPVVPATYQGGVTSTFGSILASTTAPTFLVENAYTFAATASLTTPAGVYAANLSMIATGTY